MPILNRTSVTRDPYLIPSSYNTYGFGDSFMDNSGGTGSLGQSIRLFTSQHAKFLEQATGGWYLSVEIKAQFDTLFATLPYYVNTIVLQGGINDLTDPNNRNTTDLEMQTVMSAMADAVIATGNHNLIIINVTPFMGHASWTSALQVRLEAYNNWLAENYGDYVVDAYTALGDSAEPRQLADSFYQGVTNDDRTNLHPNDNGYRAIDQSIGEHLFTRNITDLTEPVGNIMPAYRDFSAWTFTGLNGVAGNTITLPDNTTGSANGLLPATSTNTIKRMEANTSSAIAVSTTIEMIAYIRPAERYFAWLQFTKSDGKTLQLYVDLVNALLGGQAGTAAGGDEIWSIEKSAFGFLKIKLLVTNSATGTGIHNVNIRPANTISSLGTVASPRLVDAYPPEIFVDAVSVRAV